MTRAEPVAERQSRKDGGAGVGVMAKNPRRDTRSWTVVNATAGEVQIDAFLRIYVRAIMSELDRERVSDNVA